MALVKSLLATARARARKGLNTYRSNKGKYF